MLIIIINKIPNNLFGKLLNISPKNFIFLKCFDSEFSFIEIWFTDQNSKPLETEDKIDITLVINLSMTRYSVQPRDQIFVEGYGFFSFAKNMGRNIGKNVIKNLSSKYSQKLINHAKQSATDALKTGSRRAIQKTAEATDDLMWKKKLLIKLQESRKRHQRIIEKQLQMKRKYLEKDIYLHN